MRWSVLNVGLHFLVGVERPRLLDLGAARGETAGAFLRAVPAADVTVTESSDPMLAALRARFGQTCSVLALDLRDSWPDIDCLDLVTLVLTLQFVPVEYRARIIRDAWRSLRPGGGLILVEKLLLDTEAADRLLTGVHLRFKAHTLSDEEIDRKRLALEGVLVAQTEEANRTLLERAGFEVVPFWRCLQFGGFVGIKR